MSTVGYPVHVNASLDPQLSRGLWLVKWLLAIPHYIVLAFLWAAFVVLSVVAFFAILFTGRYPRTIFEFNVGVLRWTWRVQYYAYGALATDRYPPFTLQEVPDYPAHLQVDYPEHLSRGLVLVKWWLLAIPHYIVVGILAGTGVWAAEQTDSDARWLWGGGLIGLLALVAAVVLLFTGAYPRTLFDLVLGLDRWVLRVAAYAGLMTDSYPPFRLDQGGAEPGDLVRPGGPGHLDLSATATPTPPPPTHPTGPGPEPAGYHPTAGAFLGRPPETQPPVPPPAPRWTAGRIVGVVIGSLGALVSLGLVLGGLALLVADHVGRDSAGYLMSDQRTYSTSTHAITSGDITLHTDGVPGLPERFIGKVKIKVTPTTGDSVFVGIAPTNAATTYLRDTAYAVVTGTGPGRDTTTYREHAGSAQPTPPGRAGFWEVQKAGPGPQTVVWSPRDGKWTVVVMNADGTSGVHVRASAGVTAPFLSWGTTVLLVLGGVGLLLSALVLLLSVRSARR